SWLFSRLAGSLPTLWRRCWASFGGCSFRSWITAVLEVVGACFGDCGIPTSAAFADVNETSTFERHSANFECVARWALQVCTICDPAKYSELHVVDRAVHTKSFTSWTLIVERTSRSPL